MTHRDLHPENSARDGGTSGRPSQGDESMAAPNIPDRAEVLEAADDGHGQALAMWNSIVALGSLPEPAPLDPELARKMLDGNRDQAGASELHIRAGSLVNEIDEMAAVLRREVQS